MLAAFRFVRVVDFRFLNITAQAPCYPNRSDWAHVDHVEIWYRYLKEWRVESFPLYFWLPDVMVQRKRGRVIPQNMLKLDGLREENK